MYEHHTRPLLPKREYYYRILKNFLWGGLIVLLSLLTGVLGYHFTEGLGWLDSLLNASMILTGMGQISELKTTAGKVFASGYAVFSGVIFLTTVAFIFAPVAHRFLHKFHLAEKEK